jgi:hypothetical protein
MAELWDEPVALIPESIDRSGLLAVVVLTNGGCGIEFSDTEVTQLSAGTVVTPYNLYSEVEGVCPLVLPPLTHTVLLGGFSEGSVATIVVVGRDATSGDVVEHSFEVAITPK